MKAVHPQKQNMEKPGGDKPKDFWIRQLIRAQRTGIWVWSYLVTAPNTIFVFLIAAVSSLVFPLILDWVNSEDVGLTYALENKRNGSKEELAATIYSTSNVKLSSMSAELRLQFRGAIVSVRGPRRLSRPMYSEECFAAGDVIVLYYLRFGELSPHGKLSVRIVSTGRLEMRPELIHGGMAYSMSSCEGNAEFVEGICGSRVAQQPVSQLQTHSLDSVSCPR